MLERIIQEHVLRVVRRLFLTYNTQAPENDDTLWEYVLHVIRGDLAMNELNLALDAALVGRLNLVVRDGQVVINNQGTIDGLLLFYRVHRRLNAQERQHVAQLLGSSNHETRLELIKQGLDWVDEVSILIDGQRAADADRGSESSDERSERLRHELENMSGVLRSEARGSVTTLNSSTTVSGGASADVHVVDVDSDDAAAGTATDATVLARFNNGLTLSDGGDDASEHAADGDRLPFTVDSSVSMSPRGVGDADDGSDSSAGLPVTAAGGATDKSTASVSAAMPVTTSDSSDPSFAILREHFDNTDSHDGAVMVAPMSARLFDLNRPRSNSAPAVIASTPPQPGRGGNNTSS